MILNRPNFSNHPYQHNIPYYFHSINGDIDNNSLKPARSIVELQPSEIVFIVLFLCSSIFCYIVLISSFDNNKLKIQEKT